MLDTSQSLHLHIPAYRPVSGMLMEIRVIVIGLPSGCLYFALANQSFPLAVFVTKSLPNRPLK